jgi:hypothetical protein
MSRLGEILSYVGDDIEGCSLHASAEIYQPFTQLSFLLPSVLRLFDLFPDHGVLLFPTVT